MRAAPLLLMLALLATGCLEEDNGGTGTTSPTPSPSATPTPSVSPIATPSPSPSPTPTPTPPASGQLAIRELANGPQAGVKEAGHKAFTDRATYEAFWAQLREDDTMAAPEVDFASETVVAALVGPKSNACWAVRVTDATAIGPRATVEVTTYSPPPVMCASVITHPWHLVTISGEGREVLFVDKAEVGPPAS